MDSKPKDNDKPLSDSTLSDMNLTDTGSTVDQSPLTSEKAHAPDRCYVPRRYVIVCLMSAGMFMVHAMRVNLAVTVVTILDKNTLTSLGGSASDLPHVTWDPVLIGVLHSVFYMGYLVTQIPGGYLATKLPSHRLFGACILTSGVLNMILPSPIERYNYGLTCFVRILQGLSEGLLFPTCYAVMRHWTTPSERSWLGSIVLTGVYLGPMVGLAISGVISHYFGWQHVFYVHGLAVVVWFVFWLFLSYEKPAYHPKIGQHELEMIEKEQGQTSVIYKNTKIPWKKMMKSMPVHALNVCNFARNWVFYLMLTNEPLYLSMFGFTLAENGLYAAMPHALMALVAICSGPLADVLITKSSRTVIRKAFTGIGFMTESLCFFILGFIRTRVLALLFLVIGIGVSGLTVSGWQINHLDLAPRYASVLVGISTTVGTTAGIMIPIITGFLTKNMTIAEWHDVFFLTAVILMMAVLFYSFFGSGDTQSWANPHSEVKIINEKGPLDEGQKPYGTFLAQIDYFDKVLENEATVLKKEAIVLEKAALEEAKVLEKKLEKEAKVLKKRLEKESKEAKEPVEKQTKVLNEKDKSALNNDKGITKDSGGSDKKSD